MKWFEKYQSRLEVALGPDAVPHAFCIWAAVRSATFALCQLLPDKQVARWPPDQAIQCLVMATLKEHQTLDENTCAELLRFLKF